MRCIVWRPTGVVHLFADHAVDSLSDDITSNKTSESGVLRQPMKCLISDEKVV